MQTPRMAQVLALASNPQPPARQATAPAACTSSLAYCIHFLPLKNFELTQLTSIDLPFKGNFLMYHRSVLTTGAHLCIMEMYGSGPFTVCHCHSWELIGWGFGLETHPSDFQETPLWHLPLDYVHLEVLIIMTGRHRQEPFDCSSQHDASQFHDYFFVLFCFFWPKMAPCTSRLRLSSTSFHHTPPHYISTNLVQQPRHRIVCRWCNTSLTWRQTLQGKLWETSSHSFSILLAALMDLPWLCSSEIVHMSTVGGFKVTTLTESISLYISIMTFWLAHHQISLLGSLFVKRRQKIISLCNVSSMKDVWISASPESL